MRCRRSCYNGCCQLWLCGTGWVQRGSLLCACAGPHVIVQDMLVTAWSTVCSTGSALWAAAEGSAVQQ